MYKIELSSLKIKNLTADFGTGTIFNLITNQIANSTNPTVNYNSGGEKEITFTVTFTNNTTETLKSTIKIEIPDTGNASNLIAPCGLEENFTGIAGITATVPFTGYNELFGSYGKLEYRTYYNTVTNNCSTAVKKINKPVIILDGFDPDDGRKIYPKSFGYNLDDRSIYESLYYKDENGEDKNIIDDNLLALGFDVTLVNFPNGADYIERNAMALVALLQRENGKLSLNGSSEQITIIGPSMGGLISRYALSYMEKNNIPHNTKLWVSFDSPHLGANIPIGIQETLYFFGYRGDKIKAKQKFNENFRSPAARQMLIEQLDNIQQEYPYPIDLFNNSALGQNNTTRFRQLFQGNLDNNGVSGSNGYPQNLRKIALINGTSSGAKVYPEGLLFLDMGAYKKLPISGNLKVASIGNRFLEKIPLKCRTFAGRVTINNLPNSLTIINSYSERYNFNPRGTMDIVQGGTYDSQGVIINEFNPELYAETSFHSWNIYWPNHSFIPTVSSLAFKNPNFDWNSPINRNLVCSASNSEISFDTYYSPTTNESHVSINSQSVKWLLEEIKGNPQAPHFPIQKDVISGPDALCQNSNATYTIADLCKVPSNVISWSVTGNLAVVSQSGNSVVVTSTNAANTTGTVVATFQNGQKTEKTIVLGKPIVSNPLIVGSNLGYTQNGHAFAVTPVAGATSYNWTVATFSTTCAPNTGIPTSITNTGNSALFLWTNCPGIYIVTCAAVNDCGSTIIGSLTVTVVQRPSSGGGGGGGGGCITSLEVNPNPVARTGTISLRIVPDPCGTPIEPNALRINTTNEAKIYDMQGNLRYSDTFSGDSFQINNVNLTRGNYVLNVITSSGVVIRKVIIMQ